MSTSLHSERGHATWSASSTSRNWACAGAIALSASVPRDKESIYAATGTAGHEIAEKCIRNGQDAIDFVGETVKTKEFEIEIDEDLAESAQKHVDYVRSLIEGKNGVHLYLEQEFSLAKLHPPFDAGGTADAVVFTEATKTLEIVDFKNGRGVVEATSPQLKTYALGAMLAYEDQWEIETVKSTIVQPRARHQSGQIIRTEVYHSSDLIDWTSDLMAAMRRSDNAQVEYRGIRGNSVKFDDWAEKHLKAGSHCHFCPARGMCPAARKDALKVTNDEASKWFEDPSPYEEAPPANAVSSLSTEHLAHILDGLDALEDWIGAVRGHAHARAEAGEKIPGYELVQKTGHRIWKEKDVAEKQLVDKLGDKAYTRKLVTPAQAEKALGKRKGEISSLFETPIRGTNLCSVGKTSRSPAPTLAESFFEKVEN